MAYICEHQFETESLAHPGYSRIEFDLIARLGMTILKNLHTDQYEIVHLNHRPDYKGHGCGCELGGCVARGTLEEVVAKAHQLGDTAIEIKCGSLCPLNRGRSE